MGLYCGGEAHSKVNGNTCLKGLNLAVGIVWVLVRGMPNFLFFGKVLSSGVSYAPVLSWTSTFATYP